MNNDAEHSNTGPKSSHLSPQFTSSSANLIYSRRISIHFNQAYLTVPFQITTAINNAHFNGPHSAIGPPCVVCMWIRKIPNEQNGLWPKHNNNKKITIIIIIIDFFIRRSTRDLVSVPAPLNAYTALQLRFDNGLLLFRWRRPWPLATSDICF